MNIIAIDPGNIESAYCLIDEDYKAFEFAKMGNELLLDRIGVLDKSKVGNCAIEMIASYGMPVGKETFETCVWIGIFVHALATRGIESEFVYRKEVKMNLCNSVKAKDGNVIQALKDRFGDKGTKANPGFFHGFKADCWQAFAVGATWMDGRHNNDTHTIT